MFGAEEAAARALRLSRPVGAFVRLDVRLS
jgi:hypothetical protein